MEIPKEGFFFNEETHRYYYDGKAMTGVTTVLNVIAKPALIGWAARMATEHIANNSTQENGLWSVTEETLEAAKTAHAQKRDKAGDVGKIAHKLCELYIKSEDGDVEGYSELPDDKKKLVDTMRDHFISWAENNEVKFLESEKKVYNKDWFVGGTYDFKCEIAGKVYIGDIKTGGVYDRTPFAQCAAYQYMEQIMNPEVKIDDRLIVNLKKDGKFNEEKDVYVSEHYEDDLKLFEAALEIYRNMKNRFEPLKVNYNK
tara:strand:+ start:111 stop:881 length:771 start_codon:yes stop_codon:yes gene_type:complete